MSEEKKRDGGVSRREFIKGAGMMVGSAAVASTALIGAAPAPQASSVDLKVFNPVGSYQVSQLFAPRLTDLNGITLCELSSYNWEWQRTFPVIRELLKKQFPTIKIIPWDQLGINSRLEEEDHALVTKRLKEKGCQAVIVGNAG